MAGCNHAVDKPCTMAALEVQVVRVSMPSSGPRQCHRFIHPGPLLDFALAGQTRLRPSQVACSSLLDCHVDRPSSLLQIPVSFRPFQSPGIRPNSSKFVQFQPCDRVLVFSTRQIVICRSLRLSAAPNRILQGSCRVVWR